MKAVVSLLADNVIQFEVFNREIYLKHYFEVPNSTHVIRTHELQYVIQYQEQWTFWKLDYLVSRFIIQFTTYLPFQITFKHSKSPGGFYRGVAQPQVQWKLAQLQVSFWFTLIVSYSPFRKNATFMLHEVYLIVMIFLQWCCYRISVKNIYKVPLDPSSVVVRL